MSMIPTRDTVLYVQDSGHGQPLLFIHGACGDANIWDGPIRRLAGEFRCVAYDRRGHTRSPKGHVVRPSIELEADDAADVIAACDLAPVVVIGSDHGADIALELARRYPRLVKGAILCGPPLRLSACARSIEYWTLAASAVVAAPTPRQSVDALFTILGPASWARLPDARREAARSNHAALRAALGTSPPGKTRVDVRGLSRPVRLIIGGECTAAEQQIAVDSAAVLPGADLVSVPGAGLLVYIDQPAAFSDAVRGFTIQLATAMI